MLIKNLFRCQCGSVLAANLLSTDRLYVLELVAESEYFANRWPVSRSCARVDDARSLDTPVGRIDNDPDGSTADTTGQPDSRDFKAGLPGQKRKYPRNTPLIGPYLF